MSIQRSTQALCVSTPQLRGSTEAFVQQVKISFPPLRREYF